MTSTRADLAPAAPAEAAANSSGLRRFIKHLRRRRHRFRQFLGVVFVVVLTALAQPRPIPFAVGVALTALGIAVRLWASGMLHKDRVLATRGPYAWVRHPLYTGNSLIALGFCSASGLWWSLPVWILLFWLFYVPAIQYEDAKLRKFFPEEWPAWGTTTPAIVPRLPRFRGGEPLRWSFRQSLRANGEPLYAVSLAAGLLLMQV